LAPIFVVVGVIVVGSTCCSPRIGAIVE
jgi:hypothetical protein